MLVRLLLLALAALLVATCATKPKRPRMLPLELAAADGGWRGWVRDRELRVEGTAEVHVPAAEVLSVGRGTVLLNSPAREGRYVSLWVEPGACRAAGRTYPYTAGLWVSDDCPGLSARAHCPSRANPVARLEGCAGPEKPRRRGQRRPR